MHTYHPLSEPGGLGVKEGKEVGGSQEGGVGVAQGEERER